MRQSHLSPMKSTANKYHAWGYTVIELMVALTLGVIILAIMSQVYVGSKRTYRSQEAQSRLQENGRYGVDLMSRDLRAIGYAGCITSTPNPLVKNMANLYSGWNPVTVPFDPQDPLRAVIGYETASVPTPYPIAAATIKANTDVIQIQHLSSTAAKLTNPSPDNANIKIEGNPIGFQKYEILAVTDCVHTDVFKATSVSVGSTGSTVNIAHSNSNNSGNNTSISYGNDAEVMRFETNIYFVGSGAAGTTCPADALCRARLGMYLSSDPAKWCTNATGGTTAGFCVEVIAEGVEDMQILYGVNTTANPAHSADRFLDASAFSTSCSASTTCWGNVVSVRINFLLRSVDATVSPDPVTAYPASQIPLFNGTAGPAITTPRAYRRIYTETVALRNRAL